MIKIQPDIVLNCAAYTAVDDAEDIGKKENFDTNTLGVFYLAKLCAQYKADFVILSTDYVFDGEKKEGYNEEDTQNPINSYGMAKYL
jgi:dTDP-4-dehydrorhamnose reductase